MPLIAGVVLGLLAANTNPHLYETWIEFNPFGEHAAVLGHELTLHFIINGMFMCLFFGVATKEITQSTLPGGVLNPLRRAINPMVGTFGGVLGPAALYLALTWVFYGGTANFSAVANGWAIPTATDIALAWLAARLIFGASHPAVNFLLLLAVGDDAIGLGIIAIFYPDPNHPVQPIWLLLVVGGMASAYIIRRFRIRWWPVYILIGGTLSWVGLAKAGVEPALALVPIVPFLPHSGHAQGLFEEEAMIVDVADGIAHNHTHTHVQVFGLSVLDQFEHQLKLFVDVGIVFLRLRQRWRRILQRWVGNHDGVGIADRGKSNWCNAVLLGSVAGGIPVARRHGSAPPAGCWHHRRAGAYRGAVRGGQSVPRRFAVSGSG